MSEPHVVFVDDDESLRKVLARELRDAGFDVAAFASSEGVIEAVRARAPDAVLLDLKLPGVRGFELLDRLRAADEACQIVVLTGHGAVPEAVDAMRRGAYDFLTKPVRLDVLEQTLRRAVERRALLDDNARLRRALEPKTPLHGLIGEAPAMERLRREIARVAATTSSVLIQGENGTGKELVARAIHAQSSRAQRPFVVVNCGAVPGALVESELFGHEKGAFTGADRRRIGLFEAAHEATLFLDEIGELPKAVQPALLRALQFGEIRPVGSDRSRVVDVRVVAATNRNLARMIEVGEFREDLYYRVATIVLDVPPLRERREDVGALVAARLDRWTAHHGRTIELSDEALRLLRDHDWPGNVRELDNAVERLCVLCDGERIDADHVARYVLRDARTIGELPTLHLESLEKRALAAALTRYQGDKKASAAALGIALKTLYNKMDRFGMRPSAPPASDGE